MYDIVGIDTSCVDLNVNIDSYPQAGASTVLKKTSWQGGGKVATGMVAAARLGARCAMMGCVGDDIYGKFIVNDFNLHGINTAAIKEKQGDSSFSVVVSEREAGSRTIMHRTGTGSRYTFDDMNMELLLQAKYFFISQADDAINQAADIARSAGVKVFIDADGYADSIMDMLPKIDVFVGSEFFYDSLFSDDKYEDNCRKIMDMGPEIVVFTLGDKGCAGVSDEGFFRMPAYTVDVVDTVGAGDVFHGGFLYGLVSGMPVKDAAKFACAVAAIKCTRIGGRAAIPDSVTVNRFMQDGFIDYSDIDKRVEYYERGLEHAYINSN